MLGADAPASTHAFSVPRTCPLAVGGPATHWWWLRKQCLGAMQPLAQALAQVRKRMERDMASSLERAWTGGGYGLVDGGLVTVCGSDQALKAVELLPVYPWKCLVHLHETELGLGLGLGVCTLSWSPLAVEAALRCKEIAAPPPPPTVTS